MQSLNQAAARLAKRVGQDGAPLERYTDELWGMIETRLPGFAPGWYRELTTAHRLGGAHFRYALDPQRRHLGDCTFPRPSELLGSVYHGAIDPLAKLKLVPFAAAHGGDLWLFRDDGDTDPMVIFLEYKSWNGSPARIEKHLRHLEIRLSEFLAFGAAWLDMTPPLSFQSTLSPGF